MGEWKKKWKEEKGNKRGGRYRSREIWRVHKYSIYKYGETNMDEQTRLCQIIAWNSAHLKCRRQGSWLRLFQYCICIRSTIWKRVDVLFTCHVNSSYSTTRERERERDRERPTIFVFICQSKSSPRNSMLSIKSFDIELFKSNSYQFQHFLYYSSILYLFYYWNREKVAMLWNLIWFLSHY